MPKRKNRRKAKSSISKGGRITIFMGGNEVKVRNELCIQCQIANKPKVFRDRKKYTRKKKHKGEEW